jgi:hypothetical protein
MDFPFMEFDVRKQIMSKLKIRAHNAVCVSPSLLLHSSQA